MIRTISLLGLASGFLLISPSLRGTTLNALGAVTTALDHYSPFSYIVLALAIGVGAVFSLAAPRSQ